ncbi:S-adenosyl-L-methionine-dependent methyltransferase [Cytidiella melzeri]|nr:S-adenosyl-L-methionine-dependent methyltransferase [Cytidiella melzeri]
MSQVAAPPPAVLKSPFSTAVAHSLSIVVLIGLSVSTYAYERTLVPLYSVAPTRLHMNKVVWLAAIAGTFLPALSGWTSFAITGALLFAMPQTAYWAAVYSGRYGDPVWGPVATHVVILAPMLYFGFSIVKELQKDNNVAIAMGTPVQAMTLPVCRMAVMTLQDLWPMIANLRESTERDILVYIGFGVLLVWIAAPFLPKVNLDEAAAKPQIQSSGSGNLLRIAMLPLLPYLFTLLHSPTLPKPLLEPFVHPNASLRILYSVSSPFSGVVVVGDIPPPTAAEIQRGHVFEPHSMRYLRAGHSLLGGVWTGERAYRKDGKGPLGLDANLNPLGDSIYTAFNLQEAARLVETSVKSEQENALFIGLGTGIAAHAFIRHGISSTIVEIDPAVYQAATEFFGLTVPEPEKVFIRDGRSWVMERNRNITTAVVRSPDDLFDYVIHDCFSGGGVPGHLFTTRFWTELSKVVKPEGVVAVNVAGKLGSKSMKSIVVTLQSAFSQCRAFHDSMGEHTEEEIQFEFINWVFFCSQSSNPITFRPTVEADYLQSLVREKVLSTISEREANLNLITNPMEPDEIKRLTLTDDHNPLVEWQDAEAIYHWKLMREVLPDVYWETY